jgi:L-alanine-DL-glutamate epimerase-like enolase superfamily enzyme
VTDPSGRITRSINASPATTITAGERILRRIRIDRVTVFRQWQPFVEGTYTCSGGRSAEGFDSTIVRVSADSGEEGWGEMAPLGAFYDPAFAEGARAGLALLAPVAIGHDACTPAALHRRLDLHLNGHPYVKSALDMACWDLAGRLAGLPLVDLLGGRDADDVPLYRSISQDLPDAMAETARRHVADGYRRLQVKVGLDPDDDVERIEAVRAAIPADVVLYADANASWRPADARRFLRATQHLAFTLEQPCASFDANCSVRAATDRPFVLDESIDSLDALLRAHAAGLVDGITIKIARVGGVTPARLLRDVAVELGLEVTVEDTGGAQIDTAAIAHLAIGTPAGHRTHTVDFHHWVTVANGSFDLECRGGAMTLPSGPGLGVTVDESALGEPVLDVRS